MGVYEELLHHSQTATPLPIPPHTTPLLPRKNGPAEIPVLAGEEDPAQHQVGSTSPKSWCSKKCSKCGSCKHCSKKCSSSLALFTSTSGQEQMMLTNHLALMDKPNWAPALLLQLDPHFSFFLHLLLVTRHVIIM